MEMRFVSIEAQDPQYYWITCHMDNMVIEFTTWVDHFIVINPDPQDVLSWIDQVGQLI